MNNITHIFLPNSLKWNEIEKYAKIQVEKGHQIIWDFDFPIKSGVPDEMTIRAWEFTLEHFKKTFLLQFEKETKGVIFYKGPSDFGGDLGWMPEDEERYQLFLEGKESTPLRKQLFCRDEGFERLKELAPFLPDHIPLFLLFDTCDATLAELCYDHFILGTKTASKGLSLWQWNGSILEEPIPIKPKSAILLPHLVTMEEREFAQIDIHLNHHLDCRLIPESVLTQEWQGLDTLYVFKNRMTLQGKRKLMGFSAAGGLILDI